MTESKKFITIINKMYLSDILFIVLHCEQFQKEEITGNFYFKVPEKFGVLINAKSSLLNLRNAIAHFNFKDYEKNKHEYLDALLLFEVHIGQNIKGITEFPVFENKPSVRAILMAIKESRRDLFDIDITKDDEMEYHYNKHRVLMDLCDDIALYNGYIPEELPSPWTILRQWYDLKQGTNKAKEIDIYSLPLFSNKET